MTDSPNTARDIFFAVLDAHCGGDTGLRSRVEDLLRVHNEPAEEIVNNAMA